MVHLPRDRTITVRWTMFTDVLGRPLYKSSEMWRKSIYVIGDSRGRPLYIGKATGDSNPGFGSRYWGNLQSMTAWGHGARNRLYLGRIKGAWSQWYIDLERELIARESSSTGGRHPRYNSAHKDASPDDRVRLSHAGEAPRFYHLAALRRRSTS
jgi:hypothetical protein